MNTQPVPKIFQRKSDRLELAKLIERHTGLCCARNAVQREIDRAKNDILNIDPYLKGQFEQCVDLCRNCGRPCCSECNDLCPSCGDTDPRETEDYGSDR